MNRKQLKFYREDAENGSDGTFRLSQLNTKPSVLVPKNVNVTSLFDSKRVGCSRDRKKSLFSLNQNKSSGLSSQDETIYKPLSFVIHNPKVTRASQEPESQQQQKFTLPGRIRRGNENTSLSASPSACANVSPGKYGRNGLAGQLVCSLNDFNLAVRTSQSTQNYDILIDVEKVIWLSPFEIMVISNDSRIKKAVLHSHNPIPRFTNSPSKLAICSKCCLVLYNDINWYLKWKFL